MDPQSSNADSFGSIDSEISSKTLLQRVLGHQASVTPTTQESMPGMNTAAGQNITALPFSQPSPASIPSPGASTPSLPSDLPKGNDALSMEWLKGLPFADAVASLPRASSQEVAIPASVQEAIQKASLNPSDHPIAYGKLKESLKLLHFGQSDLRERSLLKKLAKETHQPPVGPKPYTAGTIDPLMRPSASRRPLDPLAIRSDFPAINQSINGYPLVWFDNAATTHKPQFVIDTMAHFYAHDYSNIHRAAHTLAARATDQYEEARETIRQFIHAPSTKDIVFVRGTTEGINFIANTCRPFLHEGDEILLTEMEHHANIVPWQMIARETRARIRVIPFDNNGELMLDEFRRLLSLRTKVVSVTHASNTLGTILPVEEIGAMAKKYGAKVVVDGAQSIAHLPIDVGAMNCDFFVFSGHKVYAPTGIGAVYVSSELQDVLPPWQGGGNMIHRVTFDETTYAPAPNKFEAGTPSIGDAVGLRAALQYLGQFDIQAVALYEHSLLEHAIAELKPIKGVTLIGNAAKRTGLVSFTLKGYSTEQVGQELDRYGIAVRTGHHCAQPSLRHFGLESTIRPSFAIYNTHDEIDRMARVIRKLSKQA
jgi:cysteine desulfurase/selenocysteine lyase